VNEAFIIAIGGILVQAGVMLATVKFLSQKQDEQHAQSRQDLNGLGKLIRDVRSKDERRWKQQIIASVDAAETLDQARKFVNQLKEDAWRD
jgi:hypothetical protein